MNKPTEKQYDHLVETISSTFKQGQGKTIQAINAGLVMTYWQIGQHIVEFEQRGHTNAEYGQKLLAILSHDLKLKHGKGFSVSNLQRFRQFYSLNPNCATLSHNLSWSHHVELLKISNESERSFYTKQAQAANWSVRELSAHAITEHFPDAGKMIELAPSGAATRSPSWSVAKCGTNPTRETVFLELVTPQPVGSSRKPARSGVTID